MKTNLPLSHLRMEFIGSLIQGIAYENALDKNVAIIGYFEFGEDLGGDTTNEIVGNELPETAYIATELLKCLPKGHWATDERCPTARAATAVDMLLVL